MAISGELGKPTRSWSFGTSPACPTTCWLHTVPSANGRNPSMLPSFLGSGLESDPDTTGVDLGAARGTPIRAASRGTVTTVRCDIAPGWWGRDRDGHPIDVRGCGCCVDIEHAGNIVARYCHMLTRPRWSWAKMSGLVKSFGILGWSGTPAAHTCTRFTSATARPGVSSRS
jgi:hypothetical protein